MWWGIYGNMGNVRDPHKVSFLWMSPLPCTVIACAKIMTPFSSCNLKNNGSDQL